FGLCFLLLLAESMFGSMATDILQSFQINNQPRLIGVTGLVRLLIILVVNLLIATCFYLFFAPGLSVSSRSPNRKTVGLELLLKGKLLRRPVTGGLVTGLLAGGVLAIIPHVIAAINVFHGAMIDAGGLEDVFLVKGPIVDAFFDSSQFVVFLIFAFL